MSSFGFAPWEDDIAADWFGFMFDETALAEYVRDTLSSEVCTEVDVRRARAAAAVLILMGHTLMWPFKALKDDIDLAIVTLRECKVIEQDNKFKQLIEQEIQTLRIMHSNASKAEIASAISSLWIAWSERSPEGN